MKLQKLIFTALAIVTVTLTQAQDNVQQDLIGEKGANSEMALKNRGFTHIKTQKYGYDVYSYWWNEGAKHCICERINDGRVKSIVRTPAFDCNKSETGSVSRNNSYNHSSHHYGHDNSYTNEQKRNAYERGFSDGKYNKTYHNVFGEVHLKSAYSDGYTAGAQERREQTSYHHGRGGYGNYKGGFVDLSDLVGKNTKSAYAEMVDHRNFREVHSFTHDGNHRKIMHNDKTGQCVEVVFHGDRVHEIKHYDGCDKFM